MQSIVERAASPTLEVDKATPKEPEMCNKNIATGKQIIIVRSSRPSTESQHQRLNKIEPEKDSLCPSIRIGKGMNSLKTWFMIDNKDNKKYIIYILCI